MSELDRAVATLPHRYMGPGGACAVLRDGEVVARHAWGWANAERRIPFTPGTLFRMCSVTKQFTCALVLDAFPDLSALDADIRARMPRLAGPPGAAQLCHNQSGLRDYWAVAMLHGAPAESAFGTVETERLIATTASLQFRPGTRYSYCNQNFRLLADILEHRTGRSFAELLQQRLFAPAGMASAFLAADTTAMPDGTEGYEGSQAGGFRPAVNRILWTGDAGLGASLDDMIAWERFIDRGRDDPASPYRRLSAPVRFGDGAPAQYGFGLGRRSRGGLAITSHGGALRGWRSHRLHVASERLSVVVLFNHMSDAQEAALALLDAALPGTAPATPEGTGAAPGWLGAFRDPETGLAVRVEAGPPGKVALRYDRWPEMLTLQPDGSAGTDGSRLVPGERGLALERPVDNLSVLLEPAYGKPSHDIAGRYRCAELDAELAIVDAGGALYGAFSGLFGAGRMELLEPVAADLWVLPCPRALDHSPPGDWTLAVQRDGDRVAAIQVGCWLARGLRYERQAV